MAQFIPELTQSVLNSMATSGERKVAAFLKEYLDDGCVVWCNVPLGNKRLYADFLILIPNKGLLCLEVKDWDLKILRKVNKTQFEIEINGSLQRKQHPLEQARGYIQNIINLLSVDKRLQQSEGKYQGHPRVPYAYGVVFTRFTHHAISKISPEENVLEACIPYKNTLYQDDLKSGQAKAAVNKRLADMFPYDFGHTLQRGEIDLIRWHLFPEIRLNFPEQINLFDEESDGESEEKVPPKPIAAPDIIKIMDIQQEQLARSLGEGHRVIHGVAGSGKTLILLMRCQYLAKQLGQPVLILCYNIVLAAKLKALIEEKGLADKVEVRHFHGWCSALYRKYDLHVSEAYRHLPYHEKYVRAAIEAMQNKTLPESLYGAVLIDEGHDFEADWLRLAAYVLDKESNHLLLLYDDAQSIYKTRKNLGFSLASVGIKAQGRTTILKLNYRNTKEIIGFAYLFAQNKMQPHIDADENQIPLVEPEAAGVNGVSPYIKQCESWQDELHYLERCLDKWISEGIPLKDIAVICYRKTQCDEVEELLKRKGICLISLQKESVRKKYHPDEDAVTICTMHSSKGLEFQRVMLMGIHSLENRNAEQEEELTRLLYVAMTRAQSFLMITLSGSNIYSQRLLDSYTYFNNQREGKSADS